MPAEEKARWEEYADEALEALDDADDSSVREVADDHLRRATVYAVLACAAAIANPPDGWGEPVRSSGP